MKCQPENLQTLTLLYKLGLPRPKRDRTGQVKIFTHKNWHDPFIWHDLFVWAKKKYLELQKEFHPDKHPNSKGVVLEISYWISQIWQVLEARKLRLCKGTELCL